MHLFLVFTIFYHFREFDGWFNIFDIFTSVQTVRLGGGGIIQLSIQLDVIMHYFRISRLLIFVALQYYATKTFQMVVGDPIQISQPTSCQKIKNFVKFPEQGVLGCVDGTHVWIISPHLNETDFVNKGYHSINVQVICDHKGKWINIVSVDVSLMTVVTPEEIGTRVMVEQDIGRWKRRFHIHLKNWMNNPESACRVIAATAVLHNIALDRNEPGIEDTEPGQEQPDDEKKIRIKAWLFEEKDKCSDKTSQCHLMTVMLPIGTHYQGRY
ncbi:putative nuclease HARBI1 [Nymphon striatum]|nr:putative nuclease HARBI1 [Nymphon striatum]